VRAQLDSSFPGKKTGSIFAIGFLVLLFSLSFFVLFAPAREASADSGSLSVSSPVILPTQSEGISFSVTSECYPNCWYFYVVTPTGDCYPILSLLDMSTPTTVSGSLTLPAADWQGGYGCPGSPLPLGTYTAYAGTIVGTPGDVAVAFTQSFTVSDVLPTPVFPLGTIVATLVPILALLAYFLFRSGIVNTGVRHRSSGQ